jgi:Fic family protein
MSGFVQFGARFDPVPGDVARRLGSIDRAAGQADLYRQQFPRLLEHLRDRARVESVSASSAIEGVVAPAARAEAIILDASETPRTRSEAELRGYSNALTHIFDLAGAEPGVSVGLILHLHGLLFEPTGMVGAGQFKTADNVVTERHADGRRTVRFHPVSATGTPGAIRTLVDGYGETASRGVHHPLLLVSGFLLDFTVIHPFADGNGRVSRLLANLLLSHSGYDVGRFVSIERQIERSKERYYATLRASTDGWEAATHDVWPSTAFMVEMVDETYAKFVSFAEVERSAGSKQKRVRRYLQDHGHRVFTMEDLRTALPGVSDATIRLVLKEMRDAGLVEATSGRSAQWTLREPGRS